MTSRDLLPEEELVAVVNAANERAHEEVSVVATQDPELIRRWARGHDAEPATGETTHSGPATVNVQDGGAGIRFNFPALGPYRPISWDEWIEQFQKHDLVFVYERNRPDQVPSARYRLLKMESLKRRVELLT